MLTALGPNETQGGGDDIEAGKSEYEKVKGNTFLIKTVCCLKQEPAVNRLPRIFN